MDDDRPSKEQLVAELRDPASKGRRGRILWALYDANYECSDLLAELVTFVIEGNFEEVQHAMNIVSEMDTTVANQFMDDTIARLRVALEATATDDWRYEALDILLDIFETNREPEEP